MNIRIFTLAVALCLPLGGRAQPDETSPPQESTAPPEEIVVTGDSSMVQLRTQMMAAEQKAYDVFNQFNDEKRFHISCRMHQPTGTRIERQICQPAFEADATAAHGRDYWESLRALLDPHNMDYSPPAQHPPAEAVIARQLPAYQRKLKQVAEEHPEFLDAIVKYGELRQRYEIGDSGTGH